MLVRRRSQRTENREESTLRVPQGKQSIVESRKVQSKKGAACRAPTGRVRREREEGTINRAPTRPARGAGDAGTAVSSSGGHDGFLVRSGSVVQPESALPAGVVEGETSAEEARSAVTSSGAVGSVMPASLSASIAGRVRSWRLLI